MNLLKLFPFMYKDSINSNNISWDLGSGIYFHGSKLYPDGGYGLLLVFVADNYSAQIDINFKPASIYYRAAHDYGDVVDIEWTKIH